MPHQLARRVIPAALAGLVGAASLLGVAELLALLIERQASPILAVSSFVIDVVPRPLKELAIAVLGDADKAVLLLGVGAAAVIGAAMAGVWELLRRPAGALLLGLGGAAATAAAVTRAGVVPAVAAIPPVVGTGVGVLVLVVLTRRLRVWQEAGGAHAERASLARRDFLRLSLVAGAGALVLGLGARVVDTLDSASTAIRKSLKLPAPRSRVAIPDGAEIEIDGITPLITSNSDFYRVDTALVVPQVDPATWTLTVTGMVEKELTLGFEDLVGMGVDEYGITMVCVSNEVGGDLIGNAIWLGVPVRDILAMASPSGDADMVLSRSVDGYTASTPLSALTDAGRDAILAVGMNGEPLPLEHGFPVRMVVPGLYGYVSATKWLTELKVTTFAEDEAYWTPRGYSAEAPVKLSSRIDTPRVDRAVPAGATKIAGMAWAQPVGVGRVEVQIDDGGWQEAVVSTAINDASWVQWYLAWEATSGTHYIAVRATDKAGTVQTEKRAPVAPNGASGLQRTLIRVD